MAIKACRSAKLVSVSGHDGTSAPARREAMPLEKSEAICTWRSSGNMSGNRRACSSALGSMFFCAAWSSAFFSTSDRARSICCRTGTEAWYSGLVMVGSLKNGVTMVVAGMACALPAMAG
ncbi:hypothetical protein D3C71_1930580 [compost metagenome]